MLAEVGADGGFSMEYPRAIHLTRSKVTDSYVVNHEVAHQWFYAQLGNDQMREPWLDEGFADFTARWLMGIGESQCSGREVDSPVFAWPAGRTTGGDWQSCDGYFHTVFYKGDRVPDRRPRADGHASRSSTPCAITSPAIATGSSPPAACSGYLDGQDRCEPAPAVPRLPGRVRPMSRCCGAGGRISRARVGRERQELGEVVGEDQVVEQGGGIGPAVIRGR